MASTQQAARYREIRRLGTGGMARVTLAEDTLLGRLVALKRVYGAGDSRAMLRLKREALLGASLHHPNLVFVYDAQLQEDGDVVMVMEYVEGRTLAEAITSRGALSPAEVMRVLRGVAAALDAIHGRGIVHRDVKPANVLLGDDGAVKLADLGVAHMADRTRITSQNAVVGSFSYMAPEQLDGARPAPAMDIYALAAVAYEMLTGEKARPETNPLTLAHAIATQPPPDLKQALPGAPAAAAGVLQRGMSADPGERPKSASELVRRLESAYQPDQPTQDVASRARPQPVVAPPVVAPATAAADAPAAAGAPAAVPPAADRSASPPPSARSTSPPPSPARWRRRSMLAPALLAITALAVLAVVIAALGSGAKKPASAATSTPQTTARRTATSSRSPKRAAKTNTHHTSTASSSAAGSSGAGSSGAGRSSVQSSSTPAASPTPPVSGAASQAAGGSASSASASSASAAGAVEQFYEAAANHQYSTAWAMADANLQSQLRGYSAFQYTFSSVRSITFHSAQVLPGSGGDVATVAVRTTSVQTNQTQQCAGTVQTVRSGSRWLLDHISITC